jgi:UDP-N-acetylglucosamine--N-acetylmuramyl-(pentapeptide) pyrophosphoryl-undecaprenol N-acetylglucosamine transferase
MIGYYVHHRGRGHLQRMQAIAAHLSQPLTVLSSLPDPSRPGPALPNPALPGASGDRKWIRLPADDAGTVFTEPTANGTMHWVPRHHQGLRTRMALIAEWIAAARPALVVVDVSVEVATLCRLMGVPTVVVAMPGDRTDRPHRIAYDSAYALLAPWTAEFASPGWPQAWHEKTFHAGAISRFGDLEPPLRADHRGSSRVLVLWGSGGDGDPMPRFRAAAAATTGWTWRFAGGGTDHQVDGSEVWGLLGWADVVVTHAGQNAVAEVGAAMTPAIVIADDRPHGEQQATAANLDNAGIAVGLAAWPEPDRWPALLAQALEHDGEQWRRWSPMGAARRAARFLSAAAAELTAESSLATTGTEGTG